MQGEIMVLISLVLGMGIGGVVGGVFGYHYRKRVPEPHRVEEETVKIKRTKPSLRNPMRPYDVRYDDFKTKRGLYEPVKPRGNEKDLEV